MINEISANKFCCEDISKIENYEQAINDTTQTWECHHRDEVKILPSGMTVIRSRQDLKDAGRYFGCPANELIFLTKAEHRRLHGTNLSDETKKKMSESLKGEKNPMYGKPGYMHGKTHGDETKQKLSEALKGRTSPMKGKQHSIETKKKISNANKGKTRTHSAESREKIAEAMKAFYAAKRKAQEK